MPIQYLDPKSGAFDLFKGIWAASAGAKPMQVINLMRSPTVQSLPVIGEMAKEAEKAINRNIDSDTMARIQEWGTPPQTGEGMKGAAMGEFLESLIPLVPDKAKRLGQIGRYIYGAKEGAPFLAWLTRPISGAVAGGTRAAVSEISRGREDEMRLPTLLGAAGGMIGGVGTAARDYGTGRHPIEAGPFDPRYQWFKAVQGSRDRARDFPFTSPEDYERLTKAASRYGQKFTVGGFEKLEDMYSKLQDALQDATERTSIHANKLIRLGVNPDLLKTNARQEVLASLEELKRKNPGHESRIDNYLKKNNSLAGIGDDMSLMDVNSLRAAHTSYYPGHISKSPGVEDVWLNQAISNAIYEGARRAQSRFGYKVKAATKGTSLEGETPWIVKTGIPARPSLMLDDAAREARDLQDLKSLAEVGSVMQRNIVSVGGSRLPIVGRFFGDASLPVDPATRSRMALLQEFAREKKIVPSPEFTGRVPYAAAAARSDRPGVTVIPPSKEQAQDEYVNPLDYILAEDELPKEGVKSLFNIKATPEGNETWNGEIPQATEWEEEVDEAGNVVGRQMVPKIAMFENAVDSARAAAKLLQKYQQKDNLNTLAEIFDKYAPYGDGDNDPEIYANHVAEWLGIKPDDRINTSDPDFMKKLLSAIVRQERSRKPSSEEMRDIEAGVDKAFSTSEPPTPSVGVK